MREEALEFGERLWWRLPKQTSYNVLLEPRWRPGMWLGRKWGSTAHLVWDAQGGEVREARAVHRRPAVDRWSLAEVQEVACEARSSSLQSRWPGQPSQCERSAVSVGSASPNVELCRSFTGR